MALSPCPHRIVDDMGYAFCMGSIGGAIFHAVKGYRNAPRGFLHRLKGSGKAISARAPVLGGNFAVWGLCFSTFDCVYLHARRKDDPLNAIGAGATTGAVLAWRAGFSSMFRSAMFGGLFLAVIEGLGLMLQKAMTPQAQQGPISPYSTYKPAGPGRHVGELQGYSGSVSDEEQSIGSGTQIAGTQIELDNSVSWNANDSLDDMDFSFDSFGQSTEFDQYTDEDEPGISFG